MKETSLFSLWKQSVHWDKMTVKQKLISAWFSLSFVGLCLGGENLLVAVVVVTNFAVAAWCVMKYVPMEDE